MYVDVHVPAPLRLSAVKCSSTCGISFPADNAKRAGATCSGEGIVGIQGTNDNGSVW